MEAFWKAMIEFFTSWYKKLTGDNPPESATPVVAETAKPVEVESRRILRIENTLTKNAKGLFILKLTLVRESDLFVLDSVHVVSGQSYAQVMKQASQSSAGSNEPIPEGYYDLGPVEWADTKGNFKGKVFSSALGPVWMSIDPQAGMKTGRSALGFHVDWNEDGAPGSAGCVVFPKDLVSIKRFVGWFDDPRLAPKKLTVNYKLGSVETKVTTPTPPTDSEWKVMVEVGHGPYRERNGAKGFEEGANGKGTTEYKENVFRAGVIKTELEKRGVTVVVNDQQDTLEALGASAAGNQIMISLHLNAFDGNAQGCETLIHRDGTAEDAELAQCIQKECVAALGITDRGVKRQGLAVLGSVPASVKAACLSEAFFIDSVADAAKTRKMSEVSAQAITKGVLAYIAKNQP